MSVPKKATISFILCVLVLLPWISRAETITLVADEWPPFNSTPGSSQEGYLVDVARAVFEDRGHSVAYNLLPWRRALDMVRKGVYNGIIGASKTDAPDFIFPSEKLSRNFISFYVRRDSNWKFVRNEDVEHVTLGVIDGYDYRDWLLQYIDAHRKTPQKVQIMTGDQPLRRNLLKLLNHRIDAIVDNEAVILNVAREMGVSEHIKLAGHGAIPADIYIAFSPHRADSQKYAEMLADGVKALRSSGRLGAILSKYGLKDWE